MLFPGTIRGRERPFFRTANAVSKLKLWSTVLDGEVVAVDENAIPRFQLLQRFQKQPTAPTLYYVFDVLWFKGEDLSLVSISICASISSACVELPLQLVLPSVGKLG